MNNTNQNINQIIAGPKCPFCQSDINSATIGYKFEDVSFSHGDLRFIDIFFCRKCGAVLNVERSIKQELEE